MSKKIFVVDSQRLNCIQMCMKRYYYQFGKSFDPIETPIHFERGDVIHHGLEFYYKARQVQNKWAELNLTHADIVQQTVDAMRTRAIETNIQVEDLEECVSTVIEYIKHYYNDGWYDIKTVELVSSKILYEDEEIVILYEGKIDLVISLQNYPFMLVDHKTEKKRNYNRSDMDNQFMGYCWSLEVNNLIVNRIGFQKTLKPEEKFYRETLSYTNARLEEWKENAIFWIKQAIQYIEHDLFPMNWTSCDKYAGCTYRSVCSKNPEDREDALNKLYKIREEQWDVGKHL